MRQNVYTVGIDLAKKLFHLVGTDTTGKIVWRKRLTRHALGPFMAQLPPGDHRHGGLWWGSLLGAPIPPSRTYCQTHGAPVCEALGEVEQKRYV